MSSAPSERDAATYPGRMGVFSREISQPVVTAALAGDPSLGSGKCSSLTHSDWRPPAAFRPSKSLTGPSRSKRRRATTSSRSPRLRLVLRDRDVAATARADVQHAEAGRGDNIGDQPAAKGTAAARRTHPNRPSPTRDGWWTARPPSRSIVAEWVHDAHLLASGSGAG
jgi:hypothetical protein